MSAAALPQHDLRARRALERLVECVHGKFTGSLEIHFRGGEVREIRKTEVEHVGKTPTDLTLDG